MEGVNPFYQLVCLVIMVKNLMDFGFIQIYAFLSDMNFAEGFEMYGFDLFYEEGPLLIFLLSFYFLIVLVFIELINLLFPFAAHLECLLSEVVSDEIEVVVYFEESDVSGPDEFFCCKSFLDGGYFVCEEEEHDELGFDGYGKVLDFVHVDSVLSLEVVSVVDSVESVHHFIDIPIVQVKLKGREDVQIRPNVQVEEGFQLFLVY